MKRLIKEEFIFLPKSKIKAGEGKTNGLYPFFTSSDIKKQYLDSFLFDDELLFIGTGGSPSCNYYYGKASCSTDNFVLKSKGRINTKYLYYLLRNDNFSLLSKGFHGAGLKHLGKDYLENVAFELKKPERQQKIVEELDSIIKLIKEKESKISSFDELVKSRFIEMFKTIDLSEQKDDWVEIESKSRIITGTTPSTNDESNWGGNILWITPAEMTKETFYVYDTTRKLTENGRKSKSLELMPEGTVLLSTRAPIGKVGIVGKPMACNQGFKNFICDSSVNPIFLYVLLKNNTDYLNSLGSGTTFLEISKTKIGKMKIPVPEIKKQIEFAEFVKLIDKSKFIVRKEIELLQELLESKMYEYFGNN